MRFNLLVNWAKGFKSNVSSESISFQTETKDFRGVVGGPDTNPQQSLTGICMQNGEGTKAEMVPVDLQWFVLYCDANRPTLEQCNDMYDASSDYDYTDDRKEVKTVTREIYYG